LILALDAGEWSASCPTCFTHGVRALGFHWIGGWVGPRAEKNSQLLLGIKPQNPGVESAAAQDLLLECSG